MRILAFLLGVVAMCSATSASPVDQDIVKRDTMCYPRYTWGAGRANILLQENNLVRWYLNASVAHGKVVRVGSVNGHVNTNSYLTSAPPSFNIIPIDSTAQFDIQIAGKANSTLCVNANYGRWELGQCSDQLLNAWNIYCSCPDNKANPQPFCHFVSSKSGKCVTYTGPERPLSLTTCGAFDNTNTKQAWEISIESGWDN
ncbi:hypothetical protein JCM10908_004304 [Rhodotorula pacifica]|uniref:uncharacterized protein n=1 Tax=Rhodotorula pacifica TaxID=1495444 RepID=UPI00317209B5